MWSKLAEELEPIGFVLATVHSEHERELARKVGVRELPHLVLLTDGKVSSARYLLTISKQFRVRGGGGHRAIMCGFCKNFWAQSQNISEKMVLVENICFCALFFFYPEVLCILIVLGGRNSNSSK